MTIEVRAVNVDMSEALQQHTEEKFMQVTQRFDRLVGTLTVKLIDANGPKGGMDKACKVIATLRDSTQVVIEQFGQDLYGAIDQAAGRFKQVLGRHINRIPKSHRRHRVSTSGL